LHPFDIKELKNTIEPEEALKKLKRFGGFPEPFLEGSKENTAGG